jgi:hypothetical protein
MESSILTSTKKTLGITKDYTAFDLDIITHINAVFAILFQFGIGQVDGFMIEDDNATWDEFEVPQHQLNLIRTLMFLRVRLLFDPPTTSFLLEAMNKQISELEWRLSVFREGDQWVSAFPVTTEIL